MAHLTDNFTFEGPLSLRVREAIAAALEQGWADPKKLNQASHRALELRRSAIEEFAQELAVAPAAIEIVGEPHLLHHLALRGFLTEQSHLYTSPVDLGKIRAIARAHQGPTSEMVLGNGGAITLPLQLSTDDVISLQAENGETGITQDLNPWRGLPARVVIDATRSIPAPGLTEGFSVATFDAQSWSGPGGLGLLIINDGESYRYPLAHIAPIRTPGSYSLPLLVGSVIALHEYIASRTRINELRNSLASQLRLLDEVTVIGEKSEESRYLSIIVDGISGEEVLRALLKLGTSTDSGSACSPEDLTPSHVIAAMGYPTTGHLRFTIHPETSQLEIDKLSHSISQIVQELRS